MSSFMHLFKARMEKQKVEPRLRRFINQYVARRTAATEQRSESRTSMTIVVVVVPVHDETPLSDAAFSTVTTDFCGTGLSIILNQPFVREELIIGFPCESEPMFARGHVAHSEPLGGGFSQVGIELTELVEAEAEICQLRSIVQQMCD